MSFRDSATAEQINFGGQDIRRTRGGPVVMVRWNRKKLNVYRVKVEKENGSHADARRVIRSISTYVHHTGWKYLQVPFVRHDDPTLNPTGKRQLTNYNVVVEGSPAYLSPPARAPRKLETPRPLKRNFATTSKLSKSFVPTTYIGESLLILSITFNPGLFYPPLTQILCQDSCLCYLGSSNFDPG